MINEHNLDELHSIASLPLSITNTAYVAPLILEAIREAITTTNHEEAIIYIVKEFPALTSFLVDVVKEKFPEHLYRLKKLVPLL